MSSFLVFCVFGILGMGQEYSHRIWFKDGDQYLKEFDEFQEIFGNDENIIIAFKNENGVLSDESLKKVKFIEDVLWQTPNVIRVDSLLNYSVIKGINDEITIKTFEDFTLDIKSLEGRKEVLRDQKEIQNYLVNEKYDTTLIYARFRPIEKAVIEYNKSLNYLKPKIASISLNSEREEIHIGGTVPLNVSFRNISTADMERVLPLVVLAILVLIYLAFQSFYVLLLIVLEMIFAIVYTLGIAGWMGINFSMILSMVPCIIAAVALADSIHILSSYRDRSALLENRDEALKLSLRENLRPTLLTTISTAFGFLGLYVSDLKPIHDLGIVAGIGVVASWFSTYFLIGPLLSLNLVKLRERSIFDNGIKFINLPFILKYQRMILALSVIVVCMMTYFSMKNEVNSNIIKYFDKSSEIRQANEFLMKNIGGYSGVQLIIDSDKKDGIKDSVWLEKSYELLTKINNLPYVVKSTSLHTTIKKIHKVLEQRETTFPQSPEQIAQELFLFQLSQPVGKDIHYWVDQNYQKLRVEILWNIDSSKESVMAIEELRAMIARTDLNAKVTGKAALITGLDKYILTTFVKSITICLLFVFFFMTFTFKSLKIGLLTLIPNVCPPIIGLGYLTLTGGHIDIGVILIVSVCLGISVDDTIYFFSYLFKYKKENPEKNINDHVERVLLKASKSLSLTTIILSVSFALFVFADFTPNQNFGVITSIVLLCAFIFDLLVVPAVLVKRQK
tara:strand:+ start:42517 stop:44712 length:2196 start_codon:yes stop_codon:yes gene_type:complete